MATVLDSMVKQRAGLVSLFCLSVIVVGVVGVVVGGGVVFVVVVVFRYNTRLLDTKAT